MTHSSHLEWFALRVKSNRERITSAGLRGKGYDVFLPEYKRFSSRGSGQAEVPLFPGYLFCRFNVHDRLPIVSMPGLVHIVGFGKTPVPVDEQELESLKILIQAGLPVRREPEMAVGQPIRIERGPLAGASGIIVDLRRQRFVVAISLLQRSVSVTLERDWISPCSPAEAASCSPPAMPGVAQGTVRSAGAGYVEG